MGLVPRIKPPKHAGKIVLAVSVSSKLLNFILVVALAAFALSYVGRKGFPDYKEVLPELFKEPVQTETKLKKFKFEYEGESYDIHSVANYEIYGLVVTHNNIFGIGDAYHNSKSVDVKDLCVIWGDNLRSNLFHKISFWSDPWTCWYQAPTAEINKAFVRDQLSNNHLIAADGEIRDTILRVNIGDQIHFKGNLINYNPTEHPDWLRNSSLTREDTGNGACEVMFVRDIEILKRNKPQAYDTFEQSKIVLIVVIILKLLSLLLFPFLDFKFK